MAALTVNFRSRPEILDVIGRGLRAACSASASRRPWRGRDVPDAGRAGARVELLLTDTSKPEEDEPKWTDVVAHPHETFPEQAWRIAEARLLAGRLRELVDAGHAARRRRGAAARDRRAVGLRARARPSADCRAT